MRRATLYVLATILAATTVAMGQNPGGMGMGAIASGPTVDIKGKVAAVQITRAFGSVH